MHTNTHKHRHAFTQNTQSICTSVKAASITCAGAALLEDVCSESDSKQRERHTHMFIQRNTQRLHCSYTGLCSSSSRPSSHTYITHTYTSTLTFTLTHTESNTSVCKHALQHLSIYLIDPALPSMMSTCMHPSLRPPSPQATGGREGEREREWRVGGV